MKLRAFIGACFVASVAFLAGCGSVQLKPISIPVIPPAQLAHDICPIVKADLALLAAPAGAALLSPAQQAALTAKVIPTNDAVCAAGATVDLTDLQALNSTAFPALIAIVSAVPIPNQPAVLLALQLAQPIVQQVVSDAIAASKASTTVPASSTDASAPVAASSSK